MDLYQSANSETKRQKKLNLSSKGYKEADIIIIANLLKINDTIIDLNLKGNVLTSWSAEVLAHALLNNKTLEKIKISSNIPVLPFRNQKTKRLNLSCTGFKEADGMLIAELIRQNVTLTSINLMGNSNFGHHGCHALVSTIYQIDRITHVSGISIQCLKHNDAKLNKLAHSKLGHSDVDALLVGLLLKKNSVLTTIDLGENNISDIGAKGIGEALQLNSTLERLRLNNNKISDDGAISIGLGLMSNSALTELSLHYNKIGNSGAQEIGKALKDNSALTYLSLNTNKIGAEGAKYILEGLKDHPQINEVAILYGNSISTKGKQHLKKANDENKNWKKLW